MTRNIGAFTRFLDVAGQRNAQIIEFSNISRESSVPASTVKEYYSILEDTLLGSYLWPFGHNERKKSRPKFYFFDCGVVRSIQNRLEDPPTAQETGFLFETWLINEALRIRDYGNKSWNFSFWRERSHEVDLLITKGKTILLAIECKTGSSYDKSSLYHFRERFPGVEVVVVSLSDERPRKTEHAEVVPWRELLHRLEGL